ncbi:hypothetical protein PFISCL1PPCAC_25853, partial [Pristionchus fissidentatus]
NRGREGEVALVLVTVHSYSHALLDIGAVSARSTTNLANCLALIIYLGSCPSAVMIWVQRETVPGHNV